jgi:AcrR family transcriptional regulator
MSKPAAIAQRARTDEQKALRRRAILESADVHFAAVGFEAFSMAELARLAGVVKGTLYLYFETREEVLLALFGEKLEAWVAGLTAGVSADAADSGFASAFYDSAYTDPTFLPLLSRLDSVIEHNVSLDRLIDAKRTMAGAFDTLSNTLAPWLGLSPTQTYDAIASLGSLLLGVSQLDAGPTVEENALPEDVRRFMSAFSSRDLFLTNACRMLAGIRGDT